jgi:hypothetical protein
MRDSYSRIARTIIATPIMMPSSAQFLSRDVIFIFKPQKLKTKSYKGPPAKGLHFIMKALNIGLAFHAADNYALFAVELVVGRIEAHQISYLHHAYSIPRERLCVKNCFYMWS